MDNLDKFLRKISYKFPKGYPDMNDPNDKALLFELASKVMVEQEEEEKPKISDIDEIKDLLNLIKDDKEALAKIKRFIKNRPIESTFFDDLVNQSNVTDKTVDTSNAPRVVFDILSDNDDLQKFAEFKKPSYSELPQEGNLISFFKSKSGLSEDSLKKIFLFSGKESGRGVGKGEVGLALMFDDVKMASAGAGDLDWNGKSLEVKGSNARLGGRDRVFGGFKKSPLGKLATEYDKSDSVMISLIPNLFDEEDINKNELLDAVIDFAQTAHPKGDAKKYITMDILDDPINLRKALTKNYIHHYTNSHNIDHFIWWNTNKKYGDYISFSPNEIDDLVDKNVLRTNNIAIHQLDPSISKP